MADHTMTFHLLDEMEQKEEILNLSGDELHFENLQDRFSNVVGYCYIRASKGSKSDMPWVLVPDFALLQYIVATWAKDCREFVVLKRALDRQSPNSSPLSMNITLNSTAGSRCPSWETPDPTNVVDLFTQEEADLLGEERLSLYDGKVTLAVSGDDLVRWVWKEIAKGKALGDMELSSDGDTTLKLTTEVWMTCLIRKNKCKF
jgi:hypothetical protein